MGSVRVLRDPLLAIEFLSLTFACSARPLAHDSATSETGEPADASDEDSQPTTTHQQTEETETADWNTSAWGPDGYHDVYEPYWDCDPLAQECPDQHKCVPVFDDQGQLARTSCVPYGGANQAGDPCTHQGFDAGQDDCDATSLCWFVEDGSGVCVPFCGGFADSLTCPAELMCFHPSLQAPALFVCVEPCDPLAQDCPSGQACQWTAEGFGCSPSNDVAPLGPCASVFDCAAGSICLLGQVLGDGCDADACCVAFCDIEVPDSCAGFRGSLCISFWGEQTPPDEHASLGVCLKP
jgi:hypothetical protein